MSASLVLVLVVAAGVSLALGAFPRLRVPGALAELLAGIVLGPSVLGVITPDDSIRVLALLGLSILLFLAGYEVDPRRFRGRFGVTVASSLGVLVRGLDPDPQLSHPLYPVKLEAIGFGLLVPIFFVTSGLTLDLSGLLDDAGALALVPVFLASLLVVRGVPALVFRRQLNGTETVSVGSLQATSLPFLLSVSAIGIEMGTVQPATAAVLVAAGLLSVATFPVIALVLLGRSPSVPASRELQARR